MLFLTSYWVENLWIFRCFIIQTMCFIILVKIINSDTVLLFDKKKYIEHEQNNVSERKLIVKNLKSP